MDSTINETRRVIVVGPPGAGKSWALEMLARDLKRASYVVARHYCFLEPGDPDVQQRVALETMSANLVSELLDDGRMEGLTVGVGGDIETLQWTLLQAHERVVRFQERSRVTKVPEASERSLDLAGPTAEVTPAGIVLIVDGLDHVARVDAGARRRATPADFASSLARLDLPSSITLVVGSQPGEHLAPLREAGFREVQTPAFGLGEIAAQVARLGVLTALTRTGFRGDRRAVLDAMLERSGGNPLLCLFLARMVLSFLEEGRPIPPSLLIRQIEMPSGSLASYYAHLLADSEFVPDAGMVAEHLSVIDFALTRDELNEILPAHGRLRIETALRHLRPVLAEIGAQGGVRIYHESLRRFVIDRLRRDGRNLAALIDPVIQWLDQRGFFKDARSYRYLLPSLRRASREREALERLQRDFVARSVVALQPHDAVEANIRLCAHIAAESIDFTSLARFVEMKRAATTAYDEKLSDYELYARTVIELQGPDGLADRLLFDGRPAYQRQIGLRVCALVDEYGGTPPWREYLRLPVKRSLVHRTPEEQERESLDELHGSLRLTPSEMLDRIVEWLTNAGQASSTPGYLRSVAKVLRSASGSVGLRDVIERARGAPPERLRWFYLELAQALRTDADEAGAVLAGRAALVAGLPEAALHDLLEVGVPPRELLAHCRPPADLVDDVFLISPSEEAVARLISSLYVYGAAGLDLNALRPQLEGRGWYRRWLRFVLDVAQSRQDTDSVLAAFRRLAADTSPFSGTRPRTVDLYRVRPMIAQTISIGLRCLPQGRRAEVLDPLLDIARGTTVYLSRSPSGPLTLWSLMDVLLPFASELPIDYVERHIREEWQNEYYDFHAEIALMLARFWRANNDPAQANRFWEEAGIYLSAYGFRKDITVFDLIESLDALPGNVTGVTERLRRLQSLPDRALSHSDGSETRHAPGEWFASYAKHSPGAAARTLAYTILSDSRVSNSRHDRAVAAVVASAPDGVPPLLCHLIWRTLPAKDHVSERLVTVARLLSVDPQRAREAFCEVAAAADGDSEYLEPQIIQTILDFGVAHGLDAPRPGQTPEIRDRRSSTPSGLGIERRPPRTTGPFLETSLTPLGLLAALRRCRLDAYDAPIDHAAFANGLIVELRRLHQSDGSGAVLEIVSDFAAHQYFTGRATVIEDIARAFQESDPTLAAELYVVAWTSSAGGGWERFGGLKHADLLRTAIALHRARAIQRLAEEIAACFEGHVLGVTRRIVEALSIAGDADRALVAWDAAFDVVDFRLPVTGRTRLIFQPAVCDLSEHESVHAYVELLAASIAHPEFERKASAIAGLAELLASDHDLGLIGVELVLSRGSTFSEGMSVLELIGAIREPLDVLRRLEPRLRDYAQTPSFALSSIASTLLARVGVNIESTVQALASPAIIPTPSEFRRVEQLDHSERMARLGRLWHDFPEQVAGRFLQLWRASPRNEEILSSQYEDVFSRVATWLPPLPHHRWDHELFEVAVDDTVAELVRVLVVRGRWSATVKESLVNVLLPDVAATIARGRSRALRPDIPLPAAQRAMVGTPRTVPAGRFAGWLRLAYWEQEITEEDAFRGGRLRTVEGGVWSGPGPPPNGLPFGSPSGDFRWQRQRRLTRIAPPPFAEGWIATAWVQRDCVAWDRGFTLRRDVREFLGLEAAVGPAAFDLVDEAGIPAAVYRRWRMRPYSYDYGLALPLIVGGEFLLRPDMVDGLTRQLPWALVEVVRVDSEELRRREEPSNDDC